MEKIMNFVSHWYRDGLEASPPVCLKSKTLRRILSDNTCFGCPCSCVKVGTWGTEWGEKYRAQIFFWGFWCSLLSMVLLAVPFASLSKTYGTIKDCNWAAFEVKNNDANLKNEKYAVYLGLRDVASECSGGNCPYDTQTFALGSSQCDYSFCNDCANAAADTETGAFLGFVTMIVQISGDLTRSTRKMDMNCQKFMGILTALIGFISTMSALSNFSDACYNNIPSNINGHETNPVVGPAFVCTLIATILKLVDLFCNIIVPAPPPGEGYNPGEEDGKAGTGTLTDKLVEDRGEPFNPSSSTSPNKTDL